MKTITLTVREVIIIAAVIAAGAGIIGAGVGRATAPDAVKWADIESYICAGEAP